MIEYVSILITFLCVAWTQFCLVIWVVDTGAQSDNQIVKLVMASYIIGTSVGVPLLLYLYGIGDIDDFTLGGGLFGGMVIASLYIHKMRKEDG